MSFVPFTRANLRTYDYEIRTYAEGYEYGVPKGTPAWSMVGATGRLRFAAPGGTSVDLTQTGSTQAQGTAEGVGGTTAASSCGTAQIDIHNMKIFEASYDVLSLRGHALKHSVTAELSSSSSGGSQLDTGTAEFSGDNSPNRHWQEAGLSFLRVPAGSRLTITASGYVSVTDGVCVIPTITAWLSPRIGANQVNNT